MFSTEDTGIERSTITRSGGLVTTASVRESSSATMKITSKRSLRRYRTPPSMVGWASAISIRFGPTDHLRSFCTGLKSGVETYRKHEAEKRDSQDKKKR